MLNLTVFFCFVLVLGDVFKASSSLLPEGLDTHVDVELYVFIRGSGPHLLMNVCPVLTSS